MTELNFNSSAPITNIKNQNFKLVKCYNAFTSLKNDMNNLSFWTFLSLMVLNIILLFLYYCSQKSYKLYLSRILRNYGYVGANDVENAFCHNYIKKLERLVAKLEERNKMLERQVSPTRNFKRQKKSSFRMSKSINNCMINSKNKLLARKNSTKFIRTNKDKDLSKEIEEILYEEKKFLVIVK